MASALRTCGHVIPEDIAGERALCPYCGASRDAFGLPGRAGASFAYGPPPGGGYPPQGGYPPGYPPPGYPPPPGYGYGPPPGMIAPGYAYMVPEPPKGLRITGGVLTIIVGSIFALYGLGAFVAGSFSRSSRLMGELSGLFFIGGILLLTFAVLSIVFGALCCAGRPAGAIGGGVMMSLLVFLSIVMAFQSRADVAPVFALSLLPLIAAIFSFVGLGQCRLAQAYRAGLLGP